MNFSVCLLGVLFLGLLDICSAKVFVTYSEDPIDIESVYAERKKHDVNLAQLATLTPNQRLEACNFYEPDEYLIDEESKPHIYAVDINENAIPKEEKDAPEAPGMSMQKSLQEEDTSKGKAPLMEEETPATLPIDTKLKNVQLQPLEVKKTEEEKKKVEMIYDQDIGFACRPKSGNKKGFVISYGFAREMLFVSDLVGEINPQEKFLGRKMKLKGYLFSPPQIEKLTQEQLEEKYYSLRVRTEKVREESKDFMKDVEVNDDISALLFEEKNILCASVMETHYYKEQGYVFEAAVHPDMYKYKEHIVSYRNPSKRETMHSTDFMECLATKENSPARIGLTRSYAEGGRVYASRLTGGEKDVQFIDVEVIEIPVLFNRKYAGGRKGVLDVLHK